MDGYTVAWVAWIAAFLAIEGKALANKRDGDTLSEHVWRWFSIPARGSDEVPSPLVRTRRIALLSFLTWLVVHFLTGGTYV